LNFFLGILLKLTNHHVLLLLLLLLLLFFNSQGTTLSADPLNVEGKHSFRSSGFAQKNAVGIIPVKGTVSDKSSGYRIVTPASAVPGSITLKSEELPKNLKAGAKIISSSLSHRKDLVNSALARYSRLRRDTTKGVKKSIVLGKDTKPVRKVKARTEKKMKDRKAAKEARGD
jgi:hypothetical protein